MVIINPECPGGGASKLTSDVTTIISQLPPVLESLTGIKFEKLMEQVPALKTAMSKDDSDKTKIKVGPRCCAASDDRRSSLPTTITRKANYGLGKNDAFGKCRPAA